MNNILISIKKFITNKNVVTVIGVIAILGLLYWGYNSTIEKETKPMQVPVATTTIQPRTQITDDMITMITVPAASVSENVMTYKALIVGQYTDVNTVIPQGSMFYTDVIVDEKDLPDSAFVEVPEGQRPYALSVTVESTYGNSIFPGNVIDVFMKATDDNGQVMVGRLLQDVKVLAVKDSMGNNVFENTAESRTPATITFGVPEDIYVLLKKAEYLKSLGVELFPAPRGGNLSTDNAITVDRAELVSYIESKSVTFSPNTTDPTVDPNAPVTQDGSQVQ
ncbi:MAG: hypothetical protein E7170_03285 [Firmicutes bacterium]|nr:hypothetical protein [Bacillota bacterium]